MKRSQLDERHQYILETVADSLGLEKAEVEDAILEGNQVRRGLKSGFIRVLFKIHLSLLFNS